MKAAARFRFSFTIFGLLSETRYRRYNCKDTEYISAALSISILCTVSVLYTVQCTVHYVHIVNVLLDAHTAHCTDGETRQYAYIALCN